jgi:hypothetical protein
MPANPPEYDRQYRSLRKESLESILTTLLEIKRELKFLRKVVVLNSARIPPKPLNNMDNKEEIALPSARILPKPLNNKEKAPPISVKYPSPSDKEERVSPAPLPKEEINFPAPTHTAPARAPAREMPPLAEWQPSKRHRELAYAEGHDEAWIEREADRYRDQQANAKLKHRDREAGFRNWIRNSPLFEGKPNGNGHAKQSPAEKLFDGFYQAAVEYDERSARDGGDQPVAEPLLDRRR